MTFTATVIAPCKVNLTLDVFPPRPDGYHDLDSVVIQFASPSDTVTVTWEGQHTGQAQTISLTCDDPTLPTDTRNLAYRAAEAFCETFAKGEKAHVSIHLAKRLPHQAGLGGGSSDAAAVLRALASQHPNRPSSSALLSLGAGLGSDVPLFLQNSPVRMRGRGESVEALEVPLPPLCGVLVKPSVGVATGPAYHLLDALPNRSPGDATPRLLDVLTRGDVDIAAVGAALENDFEVAILPAFPEVAATHRAVAEAGAVRALLCGSGSAIFGLAKSRDHAQEMTERLCGRFPWVALAEAATS